MPIKICPPLGIGDLLLLKMYEKSNNIIINEIIISINIIKEYRLNYENYLYFITEFIKKLFNNCIVTLNKEPCKLETYYLSKINKYYLYDNYNFNLKNNLVNSTLNNNNKKYIIFHTKVRFDHCINNFINELNILSTFCEKFKTDYDIVLFGEKTVEQNKEVKIHNIISIYNILSKLKNNNNVIDLTRDGLYSDNNIDDFEKDLFIINQASLNIIIGWGGPLNISLAFCENVKVYINQLQHSLFNNPPINNNIFFRDINNFIDNIKENS
jgi:hypothetical protein